MIMQEPKAEFVPINLRMTAESGSFCSDWETEDPTGGGQRCIGSQPEAKTCPDFDSLTPW